MLGEKAQMAASCQVEKERQLKSCYPQVFQPFRFVNTNKMGLFSSDH
jgi:hypothetical protein